MENSEDLVVIDVLDEEYFEEEHLPGAVNIPLESIAVEARQRFDEDQEIVVYCKDEMCTASPTAAEKLEKLGFENVYDYEPGTEGWKEAGNEVES